MSRAMSTALGRGKLITSLTAASESQSFRTTSADRTESQTEQSDFCQPPVLL